MRRNRRNKVFNEETETKKLIYISIAIVIIAVLTFVITYAVYSNVVSNKSNDADLALKLTELSSNGNEKTSEASSSMGKNVNEVKETQSTEDTTKIAINTSNIEKENVEKNKEPSTNKVLENEVDTNKTTTNEVNTIKTEAKPDPTFIKPVEGEILREFAKDNLVYSETLKEWVTHYGIDIKAEKTTIVKASAEGTVKSIKNDPRYGITVVIEHVNGYVTIYSNLLTTEFVKEGENVKQGQTIGTVGNTATFEIADESHLHFELLKDNEYLNPSEYIK